MKIVSFNVNGIRARLHQMEALFAAHDPDIIGLQEIKVNDEQFPLEPLRAAGYHVYHYGQKGHYGVALLSKHEAQNVTMGLPGEAEDAQRRSICATWETPSGPLTVFNGYFPQGDSRQHPTKFPNKRDFYGRLQDYLETARDPKEDLVIMGDFNISFTDKDIGIGDINAKRWLRTGKCSFLPEEREWMARLMGWGLVDSYREQHPDVSDRYSWFDYRSRGFDGTPKRGLRIDTLMVTESLMARCRETGVDYDMRAMEKPSDHAPVWAKFEN